MSSPEIWWFHHCDFITECTYTNLDLRVYYTLGRYGSPVLLGYKPLQHVTVLNVAGNCNTKGSICVSKHREGTVKIQYKYSIGLFPWMKLIGQEIALSESVSEWWVCRCRASLLTSAELINILPQALSLFPSDQVKTEYQSCQCCFVDRDVG